MRILLFNVENQSLSKESSCDFSSIVSGSKNYLYCQFVFKDGWDDYRRVVEFVSGEDSKFFELDDQNGCYVPDEFSSKLYFNVRLHGVKSDIEFQTNKVLVRQERG